MPKNFRNRDMQTSIILRLAFKRIRFLVISGHCLPKFNLAQCESQATEVKMPGIPKNIKSQYLFNTVSMSNSNNEKKK